MCVVQGQRFFTGHWFYSLWNTALVVTHHEEDGRKEEPIQLASSRVFRASDHDNAVYGRSDNGHGNTQSLNAIHRCK